MNVLAALVDSRCLGCSAWGDTVCDSCVAVWSLSPVRSTSGRGVQIVAVGHYRGGLRTLILAAKHRSAHAAIRRLGGSLRELALPFGDAVAIPIPSSRSGLLSRGFSPSRDIARCTDLPVVDCLTLDVPRTQRGLGRTERQERRMEVRNPRPAVGTRAILVDDVVTTGASIDAATDACWRAGIRVMGIVTLAIASRPSDRVATLPNWKIRV